MALKGRIVLVAAVLFIASSFVAAQSKDPFIGTWELNAAKSKFTPGSEVTSGTTTYEAAGSGYKISVKQTPKGGAPREWSVTTNVDGKPAKVTGNNPNADMTVYTRVNARTIELVNSVKGKETTRQRNEISADGKTRTVTTTGTDGSGKKVNNVAIYDRK